MSVLTAKAGRVVRGQVPSWFATTRHDISSALPSALTLNVPTNFWEQRFRQALFPNLLYPAIADLDPFEGRVGQTKTFTRAGLITPDTTPLAAGADTALGSYNFEQYTAQLAAWGKTLETDMLVSQVELANQYAQDINALGAHAGQTLNRVSRDRLYSAYAGGRTWLTAGASSSTSLTVKDNSGFGFVSVNGVLTAVSASNPLSVTIYPSGGGSGVANTVVGLTSTTGITLGTAVTQSIGAAIVAANAPVSIRPTGNTAWDLGSSNNATLAMFQAAVARLRSMNVPDYNGYYVAHIDPTTELQLFRDADFRQAYQGRGDSQTYTSLSLGTFSGIDWVRNTEAPTITGATGITVRRALVLGQGPLVATPLQGQGALLQGTGIEGVPAISMVNVAPGIDVAMIVRPPQDNRQVKLRTTWSWVGDFAIPTDLYASGSDPALYKRGVVVEHV